MDPNHGVQNQTMTGEKGSIECLIEIRVFPVEVGQGFP